MRFLVCAQPKCVSETVKNLGRDVNIAALLQPGVPRHPNAGELSYFLPSKSHGFAAGGQWQPHFLWNEACPARAQKISQSLASLIVRHDFLLSLVLAIPVSRHSGRAFTCMA